MTHYDAEYQHPYVNTVLCVLHKQMFGYLQVLHCLLCFIIYTV